MTDTQDARARFARFAWLMLAYTVGVILWGAYVRATGSGAGCGRHWPICNGVVIPRSPSAETLIEFTHRVTSGLAMLGTVALLWMALRRFPAGSPVRKAAIATMVLMVTEAAAGAGLVLLELVDQNTSGLRATVTAIHLANTFLLVAAMALTGWWASGRPPVRLRGQGAVVWLMGIAIVLTLAVGCMGAVTALGDTLFPKTTVGFELSPTAHFLERLRIVHPVAAIVTGLYVVLAGMAVRRMRPGRRTAQLSLNLAAIYGIQILVGAMNIAMLVPVGLQLIHLLLADVLWITLTFTAASALADPAAVQARTGAPRREPALA